MPDGKKKHTPSLHTAIKPHPRNPYPLGSQATINPGRVSRQVRQALKKAPPRMKPLKRTPLLQSPLKPRKLR